MNEREKTVAHLQCLEVRHSSAQLARGALEGELEMFVQQLRGPAAPLHREAQAILDGVSDIYARLEQLHEKARAMIARVGEQDADSGEA